MTETNPFTEIAAIEAPTYKNTRTLLTLGGVPFTMWDVVKASLGARLNLGLLGEAGGGKSQLNEDIISLFGNNATRTRGRNDLDVKGLYRQLNFSALKEAMDEGSTVSQKALIEATSQIYRPLVAVEEINRCMEVVQNQFFNIFEGFIELENGEKYLLGGTQMETFRDFDGSEWTQNIRYSVGVWTANFGNGEYAGAVSMDKAMKERSHVIIDVDNCYPSAPDLDGIILTSGGEVRLKGQEDPADLTDTFAGAFAYLKQTSHTPNPQELGEELLLNRYLVLGLDYIPCSAADDSKRIMKGVWPAKAEEDDIGNNDDEKLMYRMIFPTSVRGAMTVMSLARSLREYAHAKSGERPTVLDSVIESFKLVGAYSGMVRNTQRIRENFVGNPYRAACKVGDVISGRLEGQRDLIEAIAHSKATETPLTREVKNACVGEYACFLE